MSRELIELSPKHGAIEYTYEVNDHMYDKTEYLVTLLINGHQIDFGHILTNDLELVHEFGHQLYEDYKQFIQP